MAVLYQIRAAAAVAAGMIDDPDQARTLLRNLPLVAVLSSQEGNQALKPAIGVRMISSDQPHGASPLTGAMCLAIAAQIEGTVAAEFCPSSATGGDILVNHASGFLPVAAIVAYENGKPVAKEAIVHRTARKLFEGRVFF